MIWANLIHLGSNMWYGPEDNYPSVFKDKAYMAHPSLRFDDGLWDDLCRQMVDAGMNMVIIDLGDGVKYESHPEIAVKKAWSRSKLKRELDKLRDVGLEPIPKLNFASSHDRWLGPYHREISTPRYYQVCKDLIAEAIDLFDKPRFFHLGMDEENMDILRNHAYVVIRQGDLWWHDLYFFVEQVEKAGVRAMVWPDAAWYNPEEVYRKMPKSVVQCSWYYGKEFRKQLVHVKTFLDFNERGFDQLATGSNWACDENMPNMVRYLKSRLDPERLLGYMQTVWKPTQEEWREPHERAIRIVKEITRA